MKRRVVVTGLSVVSSIGTGRAAFTEGLRAGRSGASPIQGFDTSNLPSGRGCEARDFNAADWVKRVPAEMLGRSAQLSVAAGRLAVADSGIEAGTLTASSAGIVVGSRYGDAQVMQDNSEQFARVGGCNVSVRSLSRVPANIISTIVAVELGLTGEPVTLSASDASGNHALAFGYDVITAGDAEVMLCGGAETLAKAVLAGNQALGSISPSDCRPFDEEASGTLLGEGAASLLLESLDHALARGARIYAELLGYGTTYAPPDEGHQPDRQGLTACIRMAHERAGITAGDVSYVCAQGSGVREEDEHEAAALREVFGNRGPAVSSIQPMIGNTLGASSALSAVASVIAVAERFIPPTIGTRRANPKHGLALVLGEPRAAELVVVQNNAFATSGDNAVVLFSRFSS
jgi:3-oxoacyl-[acyl-carrier-protein] synthase II